MTMRINRCFFCRCSAVSMLCRRGPSIAEFDGAPVGFKIPQGGEGNQVAHAHGQGALLHAGGKIYHTSRVVVIHDQSDDMVRFETLNSNYCLSMAPFPLAACNPLPMVSLAACA